MFAPDLYVHWSTHWAHSIMGSLTLVLTSPAPQASSIQNLVSPVSSTTSAASSRSKQSWSGSWAVLSLGHSLHSTKPWHDVKMNCVQFVKKRETMRMNDYVR